MKRVTPALLRRMPLPQPRGDADKEARGRALVVGSSLCSPGAAVLSGLAALRSGAGKVRVAMPRSLAAAMLIAMPEAGVLALPETRRGDPARASGGPIAAALAGTDAALIGPGLTDERAAHALVRAVLARAAGPQFVIDGVALTGLWRASAVVAKHARKLVITPHAGEMAALTGLTKAQVLADAPGIAGRVAKHLGCLVVLKGADTFIVQPAGSGFVHRGGVAGLGTAGSGDVLAGLMVGLMARGATALQAALWAVHVHARAGRVLSRRVGPLGFLARELLAEIPALLNALG